MKIEGMENLLAELNKLGAEAGPLENQALRAGGAVVKEAVAGEAPRRSGTLQKSIQASRVKTREGIKQVEVGPNKEGWYGQFHEMGTVRMPANPFMSRGYQASKDQALETIARTLQRGLKL